MPETSIRNQTGNSCLKKKPQCDKIVGAQKQEIDITEDMNW